MRSACLADRRVQGVGHRAAQAWVLPKVPAGRGGRNGCGIKRLERTQGSKERSGVRDASHSCCNTPPASTQRSAAQALTVSGERGVRPPVPRRAGWSLPAGCRPGPCSKKAASCGGHKAAARHAILRSQCCFCRAAAPQASINACRTMVASQPAAHTQVQTHLQLLEGWEAPHGAPAGWQAAAQPVVGQQQCGQLRPVARAGPCRREGPADAVICQVPGVWEVRG